MQLTELSPKYETAKPFWVYVVTIGGISKASVTFENLKLAYSLSAFGPDETAAVENLKTLLCISYEQWPEGPLGEWVRVSDAAIDNDAQCLCSRDRERWINGPGIWANSDDDSNI